VAAIMHPLGALGIRACFAMKKPPTQTSVVV
jgi:hypothetical protein